jgi:hypothetical protein
MSVRGNKLSNRNKSLVTPSKKLFEIILEDVIQTATIPFEAWLALSLFPLTPLNRRLSS